MTQSAIAKFNFPKTTAYLEMPRAFYGKSEAGRENSPFKGLNSYARFLLAVIHTANKIAGQPAKLTYEDVVAVIGGSKGTVSKYKQLLIDKGIIEEEERSCYKIKIEYAPKPFDKVKKCLINEVVEMHEDENTKRKRRYSSYRKLSRKAVLILSFIESMEKNGEFISSQSRVALALGYPRTTAGDGIRESIYARLLSCSAPTDVQKISAGLTKYEVDDELKAVKCIEPKSKDKNKTQEEVKRYFSNNIQNREQPPAQEPQSRKKEEPSRELVQQIERHYYDLRHKAEARADAVRAMALADDIYGEIEKQLNEIAISQAFAEIKSPQVIRKLAEQRTILEIKSDKRLKELGINKADFEPQYKCNVCNDTGYTRSGAQCKCLERLLKTINK